MTATGVNSEPMVSTCAAFLTDDTTPPSRLGFKDFSEVRSNFKVKFRFKVKSKVFVPTAARATTT